MYENETGMLIRFACFAALRGNSAPSESISKLELRSEGLTKILEENKGFSSKFSFRSDFRSYVRSFKNFNSPKS